MSESILRVQLGPNLLYFDGVPLGRLGAYNLVSKMMEQQQNRKAFDIRRAVLINPGTHRIDYIRTETPLLSSQL